VKLSYIFGFLAVLVGLLVLMAWAAPGNKGGAPATASSGVSNVNSTELTAPLTFYDFGTISMKDGLVNSVFTVTNSTAKDINITTINTSCMCTVAYLQGGSAQKGPFGMPGMGYVPPADELIRAGEMRNIKVVYDPNAHGPAGVGMIDRFVYLTDDSGGKLELEIKAVVTP
jgi:hypothetical protein